MGKKMRWFVFSSVVGVLLCLNDRFQPFRLRSLQTENFSTELETVLRQWSDSFLAFHPAWLLGRDELREIERRYPLTITTEWQALHGTLKVSAQPFAAGMILTWQHSEFLAASDGTVWPRELWSKALKNEVPELPRLAVGSSFPLLEDSGLNGATRLRIAYQDLYDLRQAFSDRDGVKVTGLELFRRGGDDLVKCVFTDEKKNLKISFVGRISGLEKSLLVVRQLFKSPNTQNSSLDATYEDKIIIKRDAVTKEN